MNHPRIGAIALAGTLVATLTACSGQTVSFKGEQIADVDKAIQKLDEQFKAYADRTKARTSANTRCYFSTDGEGDKRSLRETGVCGPFRHLGTEKTSWATFAIQKYADGKKSLVRGAGYGEGENTETEFAPDLGMPEGALWRPDDKKPNTDEVVEEPDAPRADVGAVVIASPDSKTTMSEPVKVWTPFATCTISRGKADSLGMGSEKKQAPDKGSFALISYTCEADRSPDSSADDKEKGAAPTLALVSGDKRYELASGGDSSSTASPSATPSSVTGVALPDDGASSTVEITFDKIVQKVTADGKLDPGAAKAAYALVDKKFTGPDEITGSSNPNGDGWRQECTLSIADRKVSVYDAEKGWAKDGTAWVSLKINGTSGWGSSCGVPSWHKDWTGATYTTGSTTELKDITLAGVAPVNNPFKPDAQLNEGTLLFAVPMVKLGNMPLTVTAHWTGSQGSYPHPDAPAKADQTLKLSPAIFAVS